MARRSNRSAVGTSKNRLTAGTRRSRSAVGAKKKKGLASKIHRFSKRAGKAGAAIGAAAGLAGALPGGAGLGKRSILNPFGRKKKKTIEQKLAGRSKKHAKAVKSGNKKWIAKSERKNAKQSKRLTKRLLKRERKHPGSTEKIAAKRAKAGKSVSGAMGMLKKSATAKKASAGARNPAAKPLPSAAAPRASAARKTGLRRRRARR